MGEKELRASLAEAKAMGRNARQEGKHIESCPFNSPCLFKSPWDLSEAWKLGWQERDREIREEGGPV